MSWQHVFFSLMMMSVFLFAGEGCTPPATQSVYYAPSKTAPGNPFAGFPMANALSGLVVSPISSVMTSSSVTIEASGGQPPYSYKLMNPNAGTLKGNVFTASEMPQLAQIEVRDAGGQSATVSFSVVLDGGVAAQPAGGSATYDVYSTPVCNGSHCLCGSVTQPGVPNEAAAQAICTAYGHTTLTAYTITDGPVARNICDPSSGRCYFNNNPANIVCVTVTCQ